MSPRAHTLLIGILLALMAGAWSVWQGRMERPGPRIERSPPSAAIPRLAPAPAAAGLLAQGAALGLTPEQRIRLDQLDRAWREERAALGAEVERARERFERFTRERGARSVRLDEIDRESAEYREASAHLRARRHEHAAQAARVLTPAQRARLEAAPAPRGEGDDRDGQE